MTARPSASVFSAMPGPEVVVMRQRAGIRRANRGSDGGDLVFGLKSDHAEILVMESS